MEAIKPNGKYYAGIGSRETPKHIEILMEEIGIMYGLEGFTLRSGSAISADSAFEKGHSLFAPNNKEIYIPWKGFQERRVGPTVICPFGTNYEWNNYHLTPLEKKAKEIMEHFHPNPERLKHGGRKLQIRNGYQMYGRELEIKDANEFIACWTPGGIIRGGTGQAIRICEDKRNYIGHKIRVFNLGDPKVEDMFLKLVKDYFGTMIKEKEKEYNERKSKTATN